MNDKLIVCSIICLISLTSYSYSANVTDDNKGTKNEILINNGSKTGHQGTWTNIKDVPELKGDKGDKGDIGTQGLSGKDGLSIKGNDGLNGKDVDPTTVNNLTNINNIQSQQIGDLDNRLSKLEKTQQVIEVESRVYDSKRLTIKPFARYNITRNKVDVVGLRFTIKLGSSYEEKLIKKLEQQIKELGK